jgi:SAM-dependent methyltransferase
MPSHPIAYFDAMASEARWQSFSSEGLLKVAAFVRTWNIKSGDHVLEPGCGSGRLTAVLADLTGPTGRVEAFDCSPEFLRLAGQRHLPPYVTLRLARAEALLLAPESFDHVVCFNVFPHLMPHVVIARSMAVSLRPGGVFWIAHSCSRAVLNAIHLRGPPELHDHLLPTPRKLARLLREAGLKEVEIEDGADHFLARAIRPASEPALVHAARSV